MKNYWELVGGVEGYIIAVEQLGPRRDQLNSTNPGYNDPNSIWGQLANLTKIPEKDRYDTRKWLYTVWKDDRREIRTTFYPKKGNDFLGECSTHSPNDSMNKDINPLEKNSAVAVLPILSSIESEPVRPKSRRIKTISTPRRTCHFTMTNESWRDFYNHHTNELEDKWTEKLIPYLTQCGITCTIVFRKHHVLKKHSRKRNCNIFSANGHCKCDKCPVEIVVMVENKPKDKRQPTVFTVIVFNHPNHNEAKQKVRRPITGAKRIAVGEEVNESGPLATFEKNVRLANEDLLQEGNFTEVPSLDVLKKIRSEYNKLYRLDEDVFKDIRLLRFLIYDLDDYSEDVRGYIQTTGEWPFTIYFFTEQQLDRFADYCKSEKYSYLHIDATGSVIRKLEGQKPVFFYSMLFKDGDDPSNNLPLSGALLCDQTAASITSYFNLLRARLALRSKVARPSFVVIDCSAALLNSVLSSFNVQNVHNYLRKCMNTLDRAYDTSQLRNMTFVRFCCSHVMKAFSRSLFQIEKSKEARRNIMTLFAVLLNCSNVDGAFDLYEQIINIYANPYDERTPEMLSALLSNSNIEEFPIESYVDLDDVENAEYEPHFFDEIDINTDPIIHQSPFNIKSCDRMPFLSQIIRKEPIKNKPTNPLFSIKIIKMFYKWFGYLPLWSNIMAEYIDRYSKNREAISTSSWEFGHGRVANAAIESYFSVVKESVLNKKTRLRPGDFLYKMYLHTVSRLKANKFGITQFSHRQKKEPNVADYLNLREEWCRKRRAKGKSGRTRYLKEEINKTAAGQLANGKNSKRNIKSNKASSRSTTDRSTTNTPVDFDDTNSNGSLSRSISNESFGFSINNANADVITRKNNNDIAHLQSDESSSYTNDLTNLQNGNENIFTTLMTCDDPTETITYKKISNDSYRCNPSSKYNNEHNSQPLSPKRIMESSDETISSITTEKESRYDRKKIKISSSKLSNVKQYRSNDPLTKVGNLSLTWPRYMIKDGVYACHSFSITNTCSVDTGLFILYHAYKANTDEFRNLFETDILDAFITLRRTFQYVENDNWTVARLYWLVKHKLLEVKRADGIYDLLNTLTKVVFDFVRPMQHFKIKSKCACIACPKRIRESSSFDIGLRKSNDRFPNYIDVFAGDTFASCGENLGPVEPCNYPDDYNFDDHYPVKEVETNTTRIEQRYICNAIRIIHMHQLTYVSPYLIINVEYDHPFFIELPDPLYVGQHKYCLSAGFNNTGSHFTAIIKTNTGNYVRFNDVHPKGCFFHDGLLNVEFVLYTLHI